MGNAVSNIWLPCPGSRRKITYQQHSLRSAALELAQETTEGALTRMGVVSGRYLSNPLYSEVWNCPARYGTAVRAPHFATGTRGPFLLWGIKFMHVRAAGEIVVKMRS